MPDKTYPLCDGARFVLMRQRGEREALPTDHHFEQEGFRPPAAGMELRQYAMR